MIHQVMASHAVQLQASDSDYPAAPMSRAASYSSRASTDSVASSTVDTNPACRAVLMTKAELAIIEA